MSTEFKCQNCENRITPDMKFCANCGNELDWSTDEDESEVPQKTRGDKYCHKCGAKMPVIDTYCSSCGASQRANSNAMNKTASSICDFFEIIGFLLGAFGAILIVGSLIALVMKGPMEDPTVKRAWAIGQIIYLIFIPSGFIDVSLGLGFGCFIIGCILCFIGNKAK